MRQTCMQRARRESFQDSNVRFDPRAAQSNAFSWRTRLYSRAHRELIAKLACSIVHRGGRRCSVRVLSGVLLAIAVGPHRLYARPFPPLLFVTTAMEFAVVHSPQRHDELVVSAAKRTWQSEVVSIGRAPAADQAGCEQTNRRCASSRFRTSFRNGDANSASTTATRLATYVVDPFSPGKAPWESREL